MYPHERSLVKRFAGLPFAILGVNSDSDREALKKVLVEKNLTWRSWWNGPDGANTKGGIAEQWNVSGWPTTYVLDAKGVIRFKNVRGDALDDALETLLAEMGVKVPPKEEHEADGAAGL